MHIFRAGSEYTMNGDGLALQSSHRIRNMLILDGMSFVAICFSVAGLSVLGYQCLLWMKYGLWSRLAFRLVLELIGAREPHFGWQSAEKTSTWICDLPLSGVMFAAGLVAVASGLAITAGGSPRGAMQSGPEGSALDKPEGIYSSKPN
jgi:hypothetical protein